MGYAKVSIKHTDWNGTETSVNEYGTKPDQYSVSEKTPKPKTGNGRGWRERHKTGDIVMSNYQGSGIRVVSDPPVLRLRRAYGNSMNPDWAWDTVLTADVMAEAPLNFTLVDRAIARSEFQVRKDFNFDNELITRTLAESKAAQFDLLTSIAETPETIKMVIDIIRSIRNPLKAVARHKKALKRRKTHAIDKATETWLMYRYGIVPAMLTAADLMEALSDEYRKYQTSRGKDTEVHDEYSEPLNVGFGAFGFSSEVAEMADLVIQNRSKRSVVIKNCFDTNSWQRRYGVSPAITAWEMIPMSFVVDWFVQVGDTIAAMHPSYESKQGATFAVKNEIRVFLRSNETVDTWRRPETVNYDFSTPTVTLGEQFAEYWNYKRVVIDPGSHLTLPVGAKLNLKRTLDGFSLSWPAIKREFQSLVSKKG